MAAREIVKHIRVSEKEEQIITELAAKAELPFTTYARRVLLNGVQNKAPIELLEKWRELNQNVSEIGNDIKQIARQCKSAGITEDFDYIRINQDMNRLCIQVNEIYEYIKGVYREWQ